MSLSPFFSDTLPSPMIVKQFKVIPVTRPSIEKFIEQHHYSGGFNGGSSKYCFGLFHDNQLIGAAIFGQMAMAGQWKRFSDDKTKVIELRRLCCIDDTPKNTESFFISKMIKWLKQNTLLDIVVSYADAEYNHSGTIYKAANFKYLGHAKGAKIIVDSTGKLYHDKSVRARNSHGNLKPFALRLIAELQSGIASYRNTKGKHTFTYNLR